MRLWRGNTEIAIICALPLEYDAVMLVMDGARDEAGHRNSYKTGRIGQHNVVLALLTGMGKASAASAAASILQDYPHLRLAFLVGICGGAPGGSSQDILLGDVVISKAIVQYDFGRQYPGKFACKDGYETQIMKPEKNVRNQLCILETKSGRDNLGEMTAGFLKQLQADARQCELGSRYDYPGAGEDRLFQPHYRHKHRVLGGDRCETCDTGLDSVCDRALKSPCDVLKCDTKYLVPRKRLQGMQQTAPDESSYKPAVHVGSVGSGDTVVKSGVHRDEISATRGIIAFEMEGAGVSEEIPCVVVKGVCDYSDSHKSKKWQDFAAVTAASALKAILETFTLFGNNKAVAHEITKDPRVQVDWAVGDASWKNTDALIEATTGISRYRLYECGGFLYSYTLEFTNTENRDYYFYDKTGDSYHVNCFQRGDHSVDFNSSKPDIAYVITH